MTATDTTLELLNRYQAVLHERLVSRRASEDYLYWTRRFLVERDHDALPTENESRSFLRELQKEQLSSSALRRAEVAIDLFLSEFTAQAEVA